MDTGVWLTYSLMGCGRFRPLSRPKAKGWERRQRSLPSPPVVVDAQYFGGERPLDYRSEVEGSGNSGHNTVQEVDNSLLSGEHQWDCNDAAQFFLYSNGPGNTGQLFFKNGLMVPCSLNDLHHDVLKGGFLGYRDLIKHLQARAAIRNFVPAGRQNREEDD